jgi:hypothetical protein
MFVRRNVQPMRVSLFFYLRFGSRLKNTLVCVVSLRKSGVRMREHKT